MADKYTNLAALTEFLNNIKLWATSLFSPKLSILSYGHSTWDDFITAYSTNTVMYCRASSNSNPGTGSQNRLAFLAYVNDATSPTEAEFQYYRSVATHSYSQQGDQVYVYKLNKNTGWSVTTREAISKVNVEKGLDYTYASGVTKLKAKLKSETALTNDSAAATETANRVYPVALDKSGYLAVNVPWTDEGGTITGITMNGSSMGTSGVVDLGTVITAHQDISGKQDKITPITAQSTQAVYPIKIDSQGHITSYGSAQTIPAAVRVKGNAESTYRTGDVNLTAGNIGAAASSHTHGNIQNGGTLQTTDVAIASGDKLVVTDSSDSSKIARTSVTFDGSTTTQFLSKKGTWETAGGGNVSYDDTVTPGSAAPFDADTLQGHNASYFVHADDVDEVAYYTADTVQAGSGVVPLHLSVEMDLLWTNASPTSEFAAQTVSLDLSDYDKILIDFYAYDPDAATDATGLYTEMAFVDGKTRFTSNRNGYGTTYYGLGARSYTVTSSGIAFGTAIAQVSWANCGTTTLVCIPYKIYGIR